MLVNMEAKDHLGKMLEANYFSPRKLSIYRVAKDTCINTKTICGVLCGRKRLPVKEAVLLARYFGERDDFFAKMQLEADLKFEKQRLQG